MQGLGSRGGVSARKERAWVRAATRAVGHSVWEQVGQAAWGRDSPGSSVGGRAAVCPEGVQRNMYRLHFCGLVLGGLSVIWFLGGGKREGRLLRHTAL